MAARVRSQAGRLARRSLDVFDVCGGVLCVSSWPCKLFSLCGERGSLYGRVSGLLVAVVPLGGQGRQGTWASVAAGCGLNTRSGQDLEHRLHHRGVWVACGLFPDRGRNPRLLHGHGIVDHGAPGEAPVPNSRRISGRHRFFLERFETIGPGRRTQPGRPFDGIPESRRSRADADKGGRG